MVIVLLLLALLVSCRGKEAVILFENDVHCHVKGYTKLAAVKDSLHAEGINVLTVSCGDFLSGGMTGNYSKGFMILKYMNAVGYDAVTIGNHEFDFTPQRMVRTLELLHCPTICCNFRENEKDVFPGHKVLSLGDVKIGFIGVVTPTAEATSSIPQSLKESNCGFCKDSITYLVQKHAKLAREEDADYVIVLSHLGDRYNPEITSRELIAATEGIDAVLDGHEHREIECDTVLNKIGKPVILSSTGAYFKNIGLLEIRGHSIMTKLIPTKSIQESNEAVDMTGKETDSLLSYLTKNKIVGSTDCDICYSARNRENTLGDLVTDAFRIILGAEIAFINSGSFRDDITKGEIRQSDIYDASPYGNFAFRADISGQDILNMLEKASSLAPAQFGGFMQVSGMKYSIDTCIVSSVVSGENGLFQKVAGERRVHDVMVLGNDGCWHPLDPKKIYSVASTDYILVNNGDGVVFSKNLSGNEADYVYANDVVASYIQNLDGRNLGMRYAAPAGRITYSAKK